MLQYRFWFGDGSFTEVRKIKQSISEQEKQLSDMKKRNQLLKAEIQNLKQFPEAIEEQARYELGMIKSGETYFQVVEPIE